MGRIADDDLNTLKSALANKNLTLYLGAGVSVASSLPTWEKLVLAMYFATISEQKLKGWRPFPNYLYAIAEWQLKDNTEPLEITARKLRKFYMDELDAEDKFLERLYDTLYGGILDEGGFSIEDDYFYDSMRYANTTLDSVARLCENNRTDFSGVKSVITYNYDELLEMALNGVESKAVFRSESFDNFELPIFHVHGFVPYRKNIEGSKADEIVFTEDQYHKVAGDPYYWSNLIQIQAMTNSVGLMVGLSLSDRNMRRLLDAVRNAPVNNINYAILQRPSTTPPSDEVLDQIHQKAQDYFYMFQNSGVKKSGESLERVLQMKSGVKSADPLSGAKQKKGPRYRYEISGIIQEVKKLEVDQQEFVLKELGVKPIWFDRFEEIPEIVNEIIT